MRCVVFAYHEIGYVCLEELLRLGAEIPLVITHTDDPQEQIWFRSVYELAAQRGIKVHAPLDVNTEEWVRRVHAAQPDFLFSFYYRKLLRKPLLEIPARGALNLHGSLLPRYRGRCPVNWVIIHDEKQTGVTLHYMTEKADAGDIVAQRVVAIDDTDTALTLYRKLIAAAPELLRETYPLLCAGTAPRIPQDPTQASYFGGRRPEDGRIQWQVNARQVFNLVRAVTHPYPGAFALWRGRVLKVWKARVWEGGDCKGSPGTVVQTAPELVVCCGTGGVVLERVQEEGASEQDGVPWARGRNVREGERLQ